jgi:TP901 family phage tail tape measure protein
MATLGRLMVTVGADISDMERGLQSARDKISGFGASISNAGAQMAVLTAPIAAFGIAGLMAAGSFEKTMNVLGVTTGATQAQLDGLSKTALDLGKTTSFSALDAAEGLLALARAGFTVGEAQSAISGVLDLAAAAETDVGTAAKIAANAISAFGLSAEDANKVAGLLAAGANASTIGIEDIAQAVQNSGAIFDGYSQSIDTLVEATAILGNKGFGGAEAGSTLKTLMTSLFSSTKEQQKVLNELGVSAYDKTTGAARPLLDIIHDLGAALDGTSKVAVVSGGRTAAQAERFKYLAGVIKSANNSLANYASGVSGAGQTEKAHNKSLADLNAKLAAAQAEYNALAGITGTVGYATRTLTEEQKNHLKSTLAGSYGINALNALLGTSAEDYAKVEAELGNVSAATDLADANTKGLTGSFEYFMGTMESLQIGALSPYLDSLGDMIRGTADWLSATLEANPEIAKWTVYIGAAAVAAGPLLIILGGLISGFGALLSPIGLLGIAIGLLTVAWINDWGGIQEKTAAVWAIIEPYLISLGDYIKSKLPSSLEEWQALWSTVWETVKTKTKDAYDYLVNRFVDLRNWYADHFPTTLEGFKTKWSETWQNAKDKFSNYWTIIEFYWININAWLESRFPQSMEFFSLSWGDKWQFIKDKVKDTYDYLVNRFVDLRNWYADRFPTSLEGFKTKWAETWANVKEKFATAWALIEPYLNQLFDWVEKNKDMILKIVIAAAGFLIFRMVASVIEMAISPFARLADAMSSFLLLFVDVILAIKAFASVVAFLLSPVGLLIVAIVLLSAAFSYLFYYDIGGFRTKTVKAFEDIEKAVKALTDILDPIFRPALEKSNKELANLDKNMAPLSKDFDALGVALTPVTTGIGLIGEAIAGAFGVGVLTGINLFTNILKELPTIVSAMVKNVTSTLETINSTIGNLGKIAQAVVHGDWQGAWTSAKAIFANYWLYMVNSFNSLSVILGAIWRIIKNTVVDTLRQLGVDTDAFMVPFQAAWDKAWTAINDKLVEWKTKAVDIANYLTNGFKNAWNNFINWFNGLKLSNPFSALSNWLNDIVKKLGDLLASMRDVAKWMGGGDTAPAKDTGKTSKRLPSFGGGLIAAGASSSMITVNVTVSDPKDKNEWRKVARMVAEEFERARR